jgi:polar amino acid transport system substrate-binding protein
MGKAMMISKMIRLGFNALMLMIVVFSGFSLSAVADDKVIKVGFSYSKAPFVFASPPFTKVDYTTDAGERGIEIDIMREALAFSHRELQPEYMTYNRLSAQLRSKKITAVATVRPEVKDAFYSDTFVYFKNAVITHPDFPRDLISIEDMASVSSVAWQGARLDLGKKFSQAVNLSQQYEEIADQKKQVALFLAHRVDAIVIDENIFLYWAKIIANKKRSDFKFHELFPDRTNFVVGFTDEKLRDDFNLGLRTLKANGTYDKIYRSYLE